MNGMFDQITKAQSLHEGQAEARDVAPDEQRRPSIKPLKKKGGVTGIMIDDSGLELTLEQINIRLSSLEVRNESGVYDHT